MNVFVIRLQPDQDLKVSLQNFVRAQEIQAGFILTTVGSLKVATLRLAGQGSSQTWIGKFEIVSLVGTLSIHGVHLHMAIADHQGNTIGGHLQEGCLIYTTAEVVIGASAELVFRRTLDEQTGFKELEIKETSP
ncbi:MAG: PPC domain-containing DNA-binding protein [Leptolyngbyaceae bacterium]|nr:PPC domain-containing DNA-binding protein [Leptolyngbyaceae bacterium]